MDPLVPAPEDEQSCLLFAGEAGESSGRYRPRAYELSLRGKDVVQHHLTHLHEIHHKVLNDDTAWGALIHIAARHDGWDELLGELIGCCRIVHEAFASFMAVSLAEQRHVDVEAALDAYPVYRPLVRRMRRLLDPVPSGHRQDLAATGIARFCMSPPVIDLVTDRYPEKITMAEIPSSWLPDQRFSIVSGVREHSVRQACAAAEAEFSRVQGRPFEDLGLDETDDRLDAAWALWETAFVNHLVAAEPRLQALPCIEANAHLAAAARLIVAAAAQGIIIPLPHELDEGSLSDAESVQRLLTATEIVLRPAPWSAAMAEVGRDVDGRDVLGLCAVGARPFLVVHGRTGAHLAAAFGFGDHTRAELQATSSPVFAVRLLVDDGTGGDLLLHATLPSPEAYQDLLRPWPAEHVAANCITASCYTQAGWQRAWLPAMSAKPTVVLVDVGLLGMIGAGRLLGDRGTVHGVYVGLDDPTLKALAWHVEHHPHVMLAIGDDLTVQLVAGQLEDLLGERMVMRDSDWSEWVPTLSAVCANVVGTEHLLRFDGSGRL
ncbi:MAG: hypothetical protein IPK24_22110 [Kineosporiaceae bacterium]|nr:hypothetical protein [Kineosporiaceae bacterium]